MEKLLEAVTSGVVPLLVVALTAIVPALTAYAVAWLRARTALQQQAITGAVRYVEALRAPAVDITNSMAHAIAVNVAEADLKKRMRPRPAESDTLIKAAVAKLPRNSQPPPA